MSKVVVIGGGVVGLCTAYYLKKKGHEVTILDKGDISDSCSFGNAGMIVPSHFVPLAAPGMIKKGVRWMFNSKSPFYVRPSFNMNLMRWGIKFVKHASAKHVEQSAIPLRDLSLLSKKLYEDLAKNADLNFKLTANGILAFYKTEKAAEEEAELAKKAIELGLDMAVLNADECKPLQPGLKLNVLGAVHYRCDAHLCPTQFMNGLLRYLSENGVQIIKNTLVDNIVVSGNRITKVLAGDTAWEADEYVIAAGSWSPALARMANVELSIMPGKGYSFMELEPKNRLTIPALLCEARVAITPMDGKIRYGGTMELDQINNRINMARVKGIVESVPDYFPDLNPLIPSEKDVWYGFRPSSPDGLPYIGRSRKHDNLVFATGHGMMGLSLAPATGLLASQIISGEQADLDLSPFTVDR